MLQSKKDAVAKEHQKAVQQTVKVKAAGTFTAPYKVVLPVLIGIFELY